MAVKENRISIGFNSLRYRAIFIKSKSGGRI